jgi:glycosyltransferase involved in cell wall biosynthesis
LTVGAANRAYCETFGVDADRMFPCPHSIDVRRFAEPHDALEREAAEWRDELGIAPGQKALLFAGKFERKKRPVELMRAVQAIPDSSVVLVMLGNGELESEVKAIAASEPDRFRVLPFQNQSRMPVVYRLGDVFVLPSLYGETWGLAVNEAMACGRPVVISDRVGCAQDVVDESCGRVFKANDSHALASALIELTTDTLRLQQMKKTAAERAWAFDIGVTENSLVEAVGRVCLR